MSAVCNRKARLESLQDETCQLNCARAALKGKHASKHSADGLQTHSMAIAGESSLQFTRSASVSSKSV